MNEVLKILSDYKEEFLIGLSVTLQMTLLIWSLGILFGSIVGILCVRFKKAIGIPSRLITFFLGGIPVLVFLYWLHYPAQNLLGVQVDGFITTVFMLTLLNTFLVAEQVRNALDSFPREFIVSAEVCGFSRNQITRMIQAPYIIRQIIPAVLLIQVVMMHSTLFASLISVDELFRIAIRVNSEVYKPVEVYSALALFFLLLSLPISGLSYYLKRKYSFVK